jgi:spore germination cell wall hydrolase CwlJ-like protein
MFQVKYLKGRDSMKKNIFVIEGALVVAATIAISFTAAHTNDNTNAIDANDSSAFVSSEDSITAGVAGTFQNIELQTSEKLGMRVSIESGELAYVTAALNGGTDEAQTETLADVVEALTDQTEIAAESEEDGVETTVSEDEDGVETIVSEDADTVEDSAADNSDVAAAAALTEEEQEWLGYLMPNVKKSLNVRKSDNEDSDVVGKLYKGDRAVIVEQGEEWTKITSGNVEGYVKNSYCLFGIDALAYAKENCDLIAKSTIDGLRVRKEPSLDGAVAGRLDQDTKLTVEKNADTAEGWVAVCYQGATCYVSADYVTVSMKLGTGVTLAEEAAAEAAKKSASSSSKSSGKSSSGKICDLAYEVDEVTLLAGIIECEAGGQDYDALLAVGAVVMNRVNSSKYPDTIFDVIHQKGQFPPATSGKLEKWLKKGPSKKAIKAAKAAIAGDDNTGGKLDFNSVSSGHSGTVIGDNVFY